MISSFCNRNVIILKHKGDQKHDEENKNGRSSINGSFCNDGRTANDFHGSRKLSDTHLWWKQREAIWDCDRKLLHQKQSLEQLWKPELRTVRLPDRK